MISIVMPTYDRASTLGRAIDSVQRQTHADWELIIVDDGSTDETQAVLEAADDPRVRIVRHEANRGVTAGLNTGLDLVRGDWFTFLGSDDEMTPDALEAMLDCARSTGANAITCNCVDSVTGKMSGVGLESEGRVSAKAASRARGEYWGMTETRLLGDLRFDERLPGYEDAVWLRIHAAARRYYLHRALRIYHTEGSDRITGKDRKKPLREKVRIYRLLGEDREYLRLMRLNDPRGYLETIVRVWAARMLHLVLADANATESA
jgi:glycosyltransferase involved in cell wall biosynthesis